MIKNKKRPAESSRNDEPLKKKPFKFPESSGGKESKKGVAKNTTKTDSSEKSNKAKPARKFGGTGAGKFSGKYNEKTGRSDKYVKRANNKSFSKENASAGVEKTDWRKFKQEKKELKLKRKQAKDSYEVSVEAKQIYEKLKCRRTEKKSDLVEKLFAILNRGDMIKKLIKAHDTARIIQCMLKYSSPPLRDELSEKLLPLVVEMSMSKYSHFCVLRMFKYGSPIIKSKLVDCFMGNVVRLAGHNISSKILDHAYHTVANSKQRNHLRQEFYGELYRSSKDENVLTLADTYKNSPNMKRSILGAVKSNLDHLANKQLVDNSLVHAVILEYLAECEEDKIEETISAFTPLIPLMLTTKDGTQAAIICLYKSTPKNRRAIIKTIKEHLVKISTHEYGHNFLVALVNCLDDTKAIKKAIYDNLHTELHILMANQWGRRVIEWLVSPADTKCFHPNFIAIMESGLQYSKKDKNVRRKEIFEQIEEPLTNVISENPKFWLSNRHIGLVTAEILKKLNQQNFEKASTALVRVVVDPAWTVKVEDEGKDTKTAHDFEKIITEATRVKKQKRLAAVKQDNCDEIEENESTDNEAAESKRVEEGPIVTSNGIEDSGLHIVLKKIIKSDKERLEQSVGEKTFGSILVQNLTEETLMNWVNVNRACFILLNIFEQNTDATKKYLKDLLKPLHDLLEKGNGVGQKLLLKKLEF